MSTSLVQTRWNDFESLTSQAGKRAIFHVVVVNLCTFSGEEFEYYSICFVLLCSDHVLLLCTVQKNRYNIYRLVGGDSQDTA